MPKQIAFAKAFSIHGEREGVFDKHWHIVNVTFDLPTRISTFISVNSIGSYCCFCSRLVLESYDLYQEFCLAGFKRFLNLINSVCGNISMFLTNVVIMYLTEVYGTMYLSHLISNLNTSQISLHKDKYSCRVFPCREIQIENLRLLWRYKPMDNFSSVHRTLLIQQSTIFVNLGDVDNETKFLPTNKKNAKQIFTLTQMPIVNNKTNWGTL